VLSRDTRLLSSAKVGAKLANAPSQALAQKRAQRRSIDVTDFGRNGVEVETAAVERGLGPLDAEVLKVGERRFAQHRLAATLQGAGAVAIAPAASCKENPSLRFPRAQRSKRAISGSACARWLGIM
jgi:hypothetical protein